MFEQNRAEADALELQDLMADRFKHSADLAVAAFMDGHKHHRVECLIADQTDFSRAGQAAFEIDALAQTTELFFRDFIGNLAQIFLRDLMAGMEQMLHHFTVIGQQDQALAVIVQTPDREKPDRVVAL